MDRVKYQQWKCVEADILTEKNANCTASFVKHLCNTERKMVFY